MKFAFALLAVSLLTACERPLLTEEKTTSSEVKMAHSQMWEKLATACPVRDESVTNIVDPCATAEGERDSAYYVFAVTDGNYYLVADKETYDMRLASESVFLSMLGLSDGQMPDIVLMRK